MVRTGHPVGWNTHTDDNSKGEPSNRPASHPTLLAFTFTATPTPTPTFPRLNGDYLQGHSKETQRYAVDCIHIARETR